MTPFCESGAVLRFCPLLFHGSFRSFLLKSKIRRLADSWIHVMNSFLDSLPVQQDANTRISVDRSPIEPNFPTIGNGTNVIYNHTYYNCTSPLDNINFRDAKIVGSLLPLGVVCLMVILGNIMVITAIRITKKLRGATNMFIGEKTMKPWIPVMRNSTIARFGKQPLKYLFKMQIYCINVSEKHCLLT